MIPLGRLYQKPPSYLLNSQFLKSLQEAFHETNGSLLMIFSTTAPLEVVH